jgi:hypothetical protein
MMIQCDEEPGGLAGALATGRSLPAVEAIGAFVPVAARRGFSPDSAASARLAARLAQRRAAKRAAIPERVSTAHLHEHSVHSIVLRVAAKPFGGNRRR